MRSYLHSFKSCKKVCHKEQIFIYAFVDFQKEYDSIWRDGRKDKLEKTSINGKFLDIIYAMYKEPNISLLYISKDIERFYATSGLKQGDMLNKIFINLFINDLPSLLACTNNGNNEKPKLEEDRNVSSLPFAKVLAIFHFHKKNYIRKSIFWRNTATVRVWNWT